MTIGRRIYRKYSKIHIFSGLLGNSLCPTHADRHVREQKYHRTTDKTAAPLGNLRLTRVSASYSARGVAILDGGNPPRSLTIDPRARVYATARGSHTRGNDRTDLLTGAWINDTYYRSILICARSITRVHGEEIFYPSPPPPPPLCPSHGRKDLSRYIFGAAVSSCPDR